MDASKYGATLDRAMQLLAFRSQMMQGNAPESIYNEAGELMTTLSAQLHHMMPEQRAVASKLITMGLDGIHSLENRSVGFESTEYEIVDTKTIEQIEDDFDSFISFMPDERQRNKLYKSADLAEEYSERIPLGVEYFIHDLAAEFYQKNQTRMLKQNLSEEEKKNLLIDLRHEYFSKSETNPVLKNGDELVFVPRTMLPRDTVLAVKGRTTTSDETAKVLGVSFAFIDDIKAPYTNASMGPNAVMHTFDHDNEYRINLFYKDDTTTISLLDKFLKFRKNNEWEVLKMIANKMSEDDYNNRIVKAMFQDIIITKKANQTLEDFGLKLVSYCQTWMKNDESGNGKAQFSIMSPHFQTRICVVSPDKLKEKGYTDDHLISYGRILSALKQIMSDAAVYEGAFVNLDELKKTIVVSPQKEEYDSHGIPTNGDLFYVAPHAWGRFAPSRRDLVL